VESTPFCPEVFFYQDEKSGVVSGGRREAVIYWHSSLVGFKDIYMAKLTIAFLLLTTAAYGGSSLTIGDITYENVTLKKEYPRSVFIQHDGGTAFIDRSALNEQQLSKLIGPTTSAPATGGTIANESATEESAEESYKRAKALLKEDDDGENWTRAVDMIRRAAEAGYLPAQCEWGMFLLDSFCVPQDVEKGEEFLSKAADAGEGRAIVELLLMTESDNAKVEKALKQAAEAGDLTAMFFVGPPNDGGTDDDATQNRAWLDRALASNDVEALAAAASTLEHWAGNPKMLEQFGMTDEQLRAKAVQALRKACEEKVLGAYYLLAERLRNGNGVEKNEEESKALMAEFKEIADQKIARGSINAQLVLADSLSISTETNAREEALQMIVEVLEKSEYPDHHMIAALHGANIVERKESDKTEGLRRALDWLRERQAARQSESVARLITNFEKRLAKQSSATAGQ
jgi:TPR repeat protein